MKAALKAALNSCGTAQHQNGDIVVCTVPENSKGIFSSQILHKSHTNSFSDPFSFSFCYNRWINKG